MFDLFLCPCGIRNHLSLSKFSCNDGCFCCFCFSFSFSFFNLFPPPPPSKSPPFPWPCPFCSSVVLMSFARFCMVPSSGVFVCVCICHAKSGFKVQHRAYFCDNVFIFTQWPKEPQAISIAGKPRSFISVVYLSLESLPNVYSFGGAVFACWKNRVKAQCLIHLRFRLLLCLTRSPPNPVFQLGGKDIYSTKPLPKLCRLRTVFSFAHVFTCRQYRICTGIHTRGVPSMLTPLMSQTVTPVKPSQPRRRSCPLSLCACLLL